VGRLVEEVRRFNGHAVLGRVEGAPEVEEVDESTRRVFGWFRCMLYAGHHHHEERVGPKAAPENVRQTAYIEQGLDHPVQFS
jgi:hypothetical protein